MVGHTGVIDAVVKAVSFVDECVGRIVETIRAVGGHLLVTADHGNAETMYDYEEDHPHTAHTTNPVPLMLLSPTYTAENTELEEGRLCDLAPTMLALAGIEQPAEMTGHSLLKRK